MSKQEKASKKNPLTHAAIISLQKGLQESGIIVKYKGPISWNSLTKGKVTVLFPPGAKFTKDQIGGVNRKCMEVVQADTAVNVDDVKAMGVFEDHADTSKKCGECKAVIITKASMKPGKPEEDQECWLEIQIGDGALDNFAKQEAKLGSSAPVAKKSSNTNSKKSKTAAKEETERTTMFTGWKPGQNTPAQTLAEDLADSLLKAQITDKDTLVTHLEPLLTMFANQAYAKGFLAASTPLPADVANLSNRL